MLRRKWLLVLMAVVVIGLAYAGYALFVHTGTEYLTVSEVKSQADSLYGRKTRVEGKVVHGTIDWDSASRTLRFALADNGERLEVVFQGIAPDEFRPGAELIVEGKYRSDGVFEATGFGTRRSICSLCH